MIDSRAVIDPDARIGENVSIGPFSIIGKDVEIGDGSRIGPHVVINGPTRIGRDNQIFQFASLGDMPQDKKYAGEPTRLEIGDRNVIREYCTMNRGTAQDTGVTTIGNDNWIMAYTHIAHDCQVGNHTIFANNAQIAGHVKVADNVILGAFTAVHQFVSIGLRSFSAMGTIITKDVPPYVMVSGNPAAPHGLNMEGLKRAGQSPETLKTLRDAYKILYRSGLTLEQARAELEKLAQEVDAVTPLYLFLQQVTRGIAR